jgi:hypothetical protein
MGMFKSVLPAIAVEGNSAEIIINRCEIKGHKDKDTSKENFFKV